MEPKLMTVGRLIALLKKMPSDMPVTITDGFNFHFYNLDCSVTVEPFVNEAGVTCCDIGVGSCKVDSDGEEP